MQLFLTPEWFNGWDLAFNFIGLVIALSIAAFSWKVYKISGENKYGYFSFAFILVALALFFKGLTNGLNYYSSLQNVAATILVPIVGVNNNGINFSSLFYRAGFFGYMVSMLGAWLLIFFVSQKKSGRLKSYYEVSQMALFIYLIFLISVVSNLKFFVFFLTSVVILGMTVLNYYKNYLNKNRNKNSFLVMWSFLLITVSNFFFIFVFIFDSFYVIGEIILLVGFLLLLYTYRRVIS